MLGETIFVLFGAILGWAMSLYGFRVSEKVNLIEDHIKGRVEIFGRTAPALEQIIY